MDAPVWVTKSVVLAVHDEQLAEHGGRDGGVNHGALEAALHRPLNLLHYGNSDIADLAASYAYGLIKDHPFVDGNKRVSLVTTELFLDANGFELGLDDAEALKLWLDLASSAISESGFAAALRARLTPRR